MHFSNNNLVAFAAIAIAQSLTCRFLASHLTAVKTDTCLINALTEATSYPTADLALAKIKQCSVIIEGRLKGGVHTHFFTLRRRDLEREGVIWLKAFLHIHSLRKKRKIVRNSKSDNIRISVSCMHSMKKWKLLKAII